MANSTDDAIAALRSERAVARRLIRRLYRRSTELGLKLALPEASAPDLLHEQLSPEERVLLVSCLGEEEPRG